MNKPESKIKLLDRLGICASAICIAHCLLTPLVILLFPALKEILENSQAYHEFHEVFAVIVIATVLFAVYPTCRRHGHKDIVAAAITGACLIIIGVLVEGPSQIAGHILTLTGSVFLITAHVKNMKVRHGKCDSDSKDCSH